MGCRAGVMRCRAGVAHWRSRIARCRARVMGCWPGVTRWRSPIARCRAGVAANVRSDAGEQPIKQSGELGALGRGETAHEFRLAPEDLVNGSLNEHVTGPGQVHVHGPAAVACRGPEHEPLALGPG